MFLEENLVPHQFWDPASKDSRLREKDGTGESGDRRQKKRVRTVLRNPTTPPKKNGRKLQGCRPAQLRKHGLEGSSFCFFPLSYSLLAYFDFTELLLKAEAPELELAFRKNSSSGMPAPPHAHWRRSRSFPTTWLKRWSKSTIPTDMAAGVPGNQMLHPPSVGAPRAATVQLLLPAMTCRAP